MPSQASAVSLGSTSRNSPDVDAGLQDRLHGAFEFAPPLAKLLGPLARQRRELVQENPDVIGVSGDDVEQLVAEHRQLLGRRPAGGGDPVGAGDHLVHHAIVDRGEQRLLGADVVIQRALAEVVGDAELRDPGGVIAAAARRPAADVSTIACSRDSQLGLRAAGSRHRLGHIPIGWASDGHI